MASFPKGSEWRKWDLHVHSPYSAGYSGTWEQFIEQIKSAECEVIGVNDYFCVAGYKKLVQSIESGDLDLQGKILFPVVEMRMTDSLQNKHNETKGVRHFNFHIIFNNDPEELKIDDIESFIKSMQSNDAIIGSDYDDISKLAEKKVSFKEVLRALASDKKFKNNYLVWLPYDEYGGIDDINPNSDGWIKENFIKDSDILGSSRQAQIDFFHWKSPLDKKGEPRFSQEEFETWFKDKKPCIKGSDSHEHGYPVGKLRNEKSEAIDKFCWIKTDPTFQGLKQIVNEPEGRVHIGQIPESLKRVNQHPTKVINSVSVKKREDSRSEEKWFNFDLPINSGMVAIIGNKGSGKSALADIIGLLGNTKRFKQFSFLNDKKFSHKKRGKAQYYKAEMTWNDTKNTAVDTLVENYDDSSSERIKYIPQSYLEDICSEVGLSEDGAFYSELKSVIFSRIKKSDRLDFDDLDGLLKHRDKEVENRIDQLVSEIKAINRDIAELEGKFSDEHLRELQAHLKVKNEELEAHNSGHVKPTPVPKPDEENEPKSNDDQVALDSKKQELVDIDKKINDANEKDRTHAREEASLEKINKQLDNIESYVESALRDMSEEFDLLGINVDDVVNLKVNKEKINSRFSSVRKSRGDISKTLDAQKEGSLTAKRDILLTDIASLNEKLSEPQKKYQKYLENLQLWQSRKDEIIGDAVTIGSQKYYEDQIDKIKNIYPTQKSELCQTRYEKSLEIYREKEQLREHYARYYGSVQGYLDGYPIDNVKNFRIKFDVAISESRFTEEFLKKINQNRSGSFSGAREGTEKVTEFLDKTNFDSVDDVGQFLELIIQALENHNGKPNSVKNQLVKGGTVEDLYNYIFSLEYLNPFYSLKWDDKELDQLSPGERGNLLLIFYLILDQNDIPLVIDQPEENLDNQTVFNTLVPCVKNAKTRRQIILVTHNPNLAVVCDADQVIHAKIHKDQGNEVVYTAGSIENPEMNTKILDVLEGTRPAFNKRDSKYWESTE